MTRGGLRSGFEHRSWCAAVADSRLTAKIAPRSIMSPGALSSAGGEASRCLLRKMDQGLSSDCRAARQSASAGRASRALRKAMSPVHPRFRALMAVNARQSSAVPARRTTMWATSQRSGNAVIITVSGEIDASNQDAWVNLLEKIAPTASAPGPLAIDVRGVDFMSGGAFAALAREARRCRFRGVTTCLVSDQPVIARMVAAGGLRPLLTMQPTVEAALSAPFRSRVVDMVTSVISANTSERRSVSQNNFRTDSL